MSAFFVSLITRAGESASVGMRRIFSIVASSTVRA